MKCFPMIKQAKEADLPYLQRLAKRSPFGLKIWGEVSAYGLRQDFLPVWVQTRGEKVTAVLSRIGDTVTLEAEENADFHELGVFCRMMGRYLFVRSELAGAFHKKALDEGAVLCHPGGGLDFSGENPPLSEVYRVLSACREEFPHLPPFEDWYVDMSHRIRHGAARAFLSKEQTSCALLTVCTAEGAILSGAATVPACRGRGGASRLMKRICESGETIFLFCERKLLPFYLPLGFREVGAWAVLT